MRSLSQFKMKNQIVVLGGGTKAKMHWIKPIIVIILYLAVAVVEKI